jgi:FLVCR family feline leukemia virus subgroup C receptor-related protein
LVFVVAGLFGAIIGGVALDKTKKFKLITIGTYVGTLVFMGAFAALLFTSNIPLDFTLISFLGLFMTGYLPIGFEFGAEITYPENEGTSSGLLVSFVKP